MGVKGKGFSGTTIKDTWTEPSGGRIRGGRWGSLGWGKKAENCTWTIIKFFKNEKDVAKLEPLQLVVGIQEFSCYRGQYRGFYKS